MVTGTLRTIVLATAVTIATGCAGGNPRVEMSPSFPYNPVVIASRDLPEDVREPIYFNDGKGKIHNLGSGVRITDAALIYFLERPYSEACVYGFDGGPWSLATVVRPKEEIDLEDRTFLGCPTSSYFQSLSRSENGAEARTIQKQALQGVLRFGEEYSELGPNLVRDLKAGVLKFVLTLQMREDGKLGYRIDTKNRTFYSSKGTPLVV